MVGIADGQWREKVRPLCPAAQSPTDVCDCGFEGNWHMRWWTELRPCPPTRAVLGTDDRPGEVVRRCHDCKRGGPGHDVIAGWEERCPRCGDIERFDMDTGELVASIRNPDGPGFFVKELHPATLFDPDRL